jgi:hypothetical protein
MNGRRKEHKWRCQVVLDQTGDSRERLEVPRDGRTVEGSAVGVGVVADAVGWTAGHRIMEATGKLKEPRRHSGHANISTTGDVYTDWDADQLAETMRLLDD